MMLITSDRLGRTSSKEQYAFLYRSVLGSLQICTSLQICSWISTDLCRAVLTILDLLLQTVQFQHFEGCDMDYMLSLIHI